MLGVPGHCACLIEHADPCVFLGWLCATWYDCQASVPLGARGIPCGAGDPFGQEAHCRSLSMAIL